MVRYFYAWTPLVVISAVVLLSLPWLALIALAIAVAAALGALAALAWAIVEAALAGGRAIGHAWHGQRVPEPTPALVAPRLATRLAPRRIRAFGGRAILAPRQTRPIDWRTK